MTFGLSNLGDTYTYSLRRVRMFKLDLADLGPNI